MPIIAINSASNAIENLRKFPVYLNVYDLTNLNKYVYWMGIGIYHSGIEVHGVEYAFGAHDYPTTGVFEVEPRKCPGFIFRRTIELGTTFMDSFEIMDFIYQIAGEYNGNEYHLIAKNCNHFSDDLSTRLTGKSIPGWVNRLANIGACCSCLLPEALQVSAMCQTPEYHSCEAVDEPALSSQEETCTDSDEDRQLLPIKSIETQTAVQDLLKDASLKHTKTRV